MKNLTWPSLAGRPWPVQVAWGLFLLLAGAWLVLATLYGLNPGLAGPAAARFHLLLVALMVANSLALTRAHYGPSRRAA